VLFSKRFCCLFHIFTRRIPVIYSIWNLTVGQKYWLGFALSVIILWGVWGAFAGISSQRGFPETLTYCIWALTMIPPAVWVLYKTGWKLDTDFQSIFYGLLIGLLGAGGQIVLFYAVNTGPAYLIFPIISLSPLLTILMSVFLLKERTTKFGLTGIALTLVALPLFDFSWEKDVSFQHGGIWFLLALIIMTCWGLQAYFMKRCNNRMRVESIFFYMMIAGLLLIPIALAMTDFSKPINWGVDGPCLAAGIQILNACGALCLVYAFRYGKAIVVAPLTNAGSPLVTTVISLLVTNVMPGGLKIIGLALAMIASILLAVAA
jgi:drug/metabolite transporter (DMT)-like permease